MVDERKLKSRMALAGITQRGLAERLNRSENTVSAKVNGKSRLYLDEIDEICSILGIDSAAEKAEIFLSNSSRLRDDEAS